MQPLLHSPLKLPEISSIMSHSSAPRGAWDQRQVFRDAGVRVAYLSRANLLDLFLATPGHKAASARLAQAGIARDMAPPKDSVDVPGVKVLDHLEA